jgi:hypothetical protein
MFVIGKYASSNFFYKQEVILDLNQKCLNHKNTFLWLFVFKTKCNPLPLIDYVLVFRTLYAKCETCSIEDFNNSSLLQLSLVYNKNRRIIIHESQNQNIIFEKAKLISQYLNLKIRDSASQRNKSIWI